MPDADSYVALRPYPDPNTNYTGYTTAKDAGKQLTLRAGTGDNVNPSFYFSWKMPGDTGGNFYRDNIAACNQSVIVRGTQIIQEPGDKSGPTVQGIQALIDKDPGAYFEPNPAAIVSRAAPSPSARACSRFRSTTPTSTRKGRPTAASPISRSPTSSDSSPSRPGQLDPRAHHADCRARRRPGGAGAGELVRQSDSAGAIGHGTTGRAHRRRKTTHSRNTSDGCCAPGRSRSA